jgi:hypothetical protein
MDGNGVVEIIDAQESVLLLREEGAGSWKVEL